MKLLVAMKPSLRIALAAKGFVAAMLACCLASAFNVGAQTATATLEGLITDENGQPVASVQVTLLGSAGESLTLYSDALGKFQVSNLRPGDITVDFSKPGFFRAEQQPFTIQPGENDLTLTFRHAEEVHEQVEVNSSSTRIDPENTTHEDALVSRDLITIPVPSSQLLARSLVALPQVVDDNSDQLHFAGARADQTEYLLDGFEINDPVTGAMDTNVNVDSVRVADLSTGRYGAEYAHAGGGVLALETTEGDDRWRFGVTDFLPGINFDSGTHLGNWYPRVTFSGPIMKGRAWFSDAATLQHTFKIETGLPAGQNSTTQWLGDNLLRASVKISSRQTLQGSFLYNQASEMGVGLTVFTPISTTVNLTSRRGIISAKDQFVFSRALLEFGVAGDLGKINSAPQAKFPYMIPAEIPNGTPYIVTPSGYLGRYFQAVDSRPHRIQFIGNALVPRLRWRGTHDLSAGLTADGTTWSQSASRTEVDALLANGALYSMSTFNGPGSFHLSDARAGVYAQDGWQILRALRVQYGVRVDWDRIAQRTLVQPRVSLNYLPFASNNTKFSAGWGKYFQPLNLTLIGQAYDQQEVDSFYSVTGTAPLSNPVRSAFLLPAGHLLLPYFGTSSAEWEQRILEHTFVDVSFTDRTGRDGLAYENTSPGAAVQLLMLGNQQRDTYRAGEMSVRHQFSEKSEIAFDYTRSSSRTNEAINYTLGSIFYAPQLPGPLPWDAPNRIVSHGWTPLHFWNLLGSYLLEYHTGFPFNAVDQEEQLVGLPGSQRFPAYFSLDLGVEKRFHFLHREWALRLTGINVTGHKDPDSVINNVDAPVFPVFAGGQGRALTVRLRLVGAK